MLFGLERNRTPLARLKALARSWTGLAEPVARYGCPHGSLCQELGKLDGGVTSTAAKLLLMPINWAAEQFALMGKDDPRHLAITLIGAFQGASLLANSFNDPTIMTREAGRLERWIDSLA